MADSVNMSLDEIIEKNKQNRASRTRGRGGGGNVRGRGGGNTGGRGSGNVVGRGGGNGRGRGRGRGRGSGGQGRGRLNRSLSQSRPGTPGGGRARSRSRGRGGRAQSRGRSQTRNRSRSQSRNRSRSNQRRSNSRARSASRSRSRLRGLTPKERAGLEDLSQMPQLLRSGRGNRGGLRNRGGLHTRLLRSNANSNFQGGVHSRLGLSTRRGMANLRKPLAIPKRGIAKRAGLTTAHQYSAVGLRSDQILRERRHNMLLIKSQTFTRSRNSPGSPSQLTVSVANDFAKRRRNSIGSGGYLNQQSLAQLNNSYGGYNTRRGPGSVKSMGSNRSSRSNQSNASRRSNRTRGRGRGRGGNRGLARNFINNQVLNEQLQKEIAAIQGRAYGSNISNSEAASGVNLTLVPTATTQTLHQRFAST